MNKELIAGQTLLPGMVQAQALCGAIRQQSMESTPKSRCGNYSPCVYLYMCVYVYMCVCIHVLFEIGNQNITSLSVTEITAIALNTW